MILAMDVAYTDTQATVAGVLFEQWNSEKETRSVISKVSDIQAYESGQFYERELPCLLALIAAHNLTPDIIIIDGHVYLDEFDTPGLGKYLFDALHQKTHIVGVAKNKYGHDNQLSRVFRRSSNKPLFVTTTHPDPDHISESIIDMHGDFRIPTLLKLVDRLCRDG